VSFDLSPNEYYVLVADTNQYSGNFHRDMGAYVVGWQNEYARARHFIELFAYEVDGQDDHPDYESSLIDKLLIVETDHGPECAILWETPGKVNDGHGVIFDEDEFEGRGWPAYNSVGILFTELPENISVLADRIHKFAALWNNERFDSDETLKITNVRLLHRKTETTDISIDFPCDTDLERMHPTIDEREL